MARAAPAAEGSEREAYRCFMNTGMDVLVLGSLIVTKEAQPPAAPRIAAAGTPHLQRAR
jgi:hypothetical protein